MARNRRLLTDADFREAMDKLIAIRVFQDDHIVDSNGVVIRFDDDTIVIQSTVSDIGYYARNGCEFFEMAKR
jgi:hypothetical protein